MSALGGIGDAGRRVVLGLDPGSQVAGFAVVTCEGSRIVECRLGCWPLGRRGPRSERLGRLAVAAEETITAARPEVAAVEGAFQHHNVRAALALAEARGVLLAVLGRLAVPTIEYSPAMIKKTICGNGAAAKGEVRRALVRTVRGVDPDQLERASADAVDALAIAVCHLSHARFAARTGMSRR